MPMAACLVMINPQSIAQDNLPATKKR